MTENEYRSQILESNLSTKAKFVCFLLLHYRNREENICYPSQDTIADAASMSPNTVRDALKELENDGYITIKKKRLRGNRYANNFYDLGLTPSNFEVSIEPSIEPSGIGDKPIEPIYKKGDLNNCLKKEQKKLLDFGGDWQAYKDYQEQLTANQ